MNYYYLTLIFYLSSHIHFLIVYILCVYCEKALIAFSADVTAAPAPYPIGPATNFEDCQLGPEHGDQDTGEGPTFAAAQQRTQAQPQPRTHPSKRGGRQRSELIRLEPRARVIGDVTDVGRRRRLEIAHRQRCELRGRQSRPFHGAGGCGGNKQG